MTMSKTTRQMLIDVFIFVLLCLPVLAVMKWGQPYQLGFWCRDQSLRYPYKPDTVPASMLLLVGLGGSFLVMFVTELVRSVTKPRLQPRHARADAMSLAKAYGTFLLGSAFNLIVTYTLKFSVGRPRPSFLSLCRPNVNCTADEQGFDMYVMDYQCTNTEADPRLLRDSRLSFPSGHASISVYSALFVIFYLQLRMKTSHLSHLLRPALQLCPLVLAILCCVTRVTDNKHFPSDVMAGVVIGASCAWLTFYKLGHKLIPSPDAADATRPSALDRTTSVEWDPTPPTLFGCGSPATTSGKETPISTTLSKTCDVPGDHILFNIAS